MKSHLIATAFVLLSGLTFLSLTAPFSSHGQNPADQQQAKQRGKQTSIRARDPYLDRDADMPENFEIVKNRFPWDERDKLRELYREHAEAQRQLRWVAQKYTLTLGPIKDFTDAMAGNAGPSDAEEILKLSLHTSQLKEKIGEMWRKNGITIIGPAQPDKGKAVQPNPTENEKYQVKQTASAVAGIPSLSFEAEQQNKEYTRKLLSDFRADLSSIGLHELTPMPEPAAKTKLSTKQTERYTVHQSEETYTNNGGSNGPTDPGGIDLRSVRWVYLAEGTHVEPGLWRMRMFAGAMKGFSPSGASEKVDLHQASQLSQRAFKTFLTVPDRDLWVNLHPAQPNRIIAPTLGQTEVGRIMLEADFQLKKDAGRLMQEEPFRSQSQHLIDNIFEREIGPPNVTRRTRGWGSTARVEIVPDRIMAHESDTDIYIQESPLSVVYEVKELEVFVERGGVRRNVVLLEDEKQAYVKLIEESLRPQLITLVNHAQEYEKLRQIYAARVLADWYKRKHLKTGAFSGIIDQVQLDDLKLDAEWSPQTFWRAYRHHYEAGSFNGFGGVNLIKLPACVPIQEISRERIQRILGAFSLPEGDWQQNELHFGRVFATLDPLIDKAALKERQRLSAVAARKTAATHHYPRLITFCAVTLLTGLSLLVAVKLRYRLTARASLKQHWGD